MAASETVLKIREAGRLRMEKGRADLFEKRAGPYTYAAGPVGSPNGMTAAFAITKDLGKTYGIEAGDKFDDIVDGAIDGKLPDPSSYFNPAIQPRYVKRKTNANEGSWIFLDVEFPGLIEFKDFLDHLQNDPRGCLISGSLHPHLDSKRQHKRRWHASARRDGKVGGAIVPRVGYWRQMEVDKLKLPTGMTARDTDRVIAYVAAYLEPIIGKVSFVYQFSSSHGVGGPDDDRVSLHLWFRSRQLIESRQWHRISQAMRTTPPPPSNRVGVDIDTAVAVGTSVCFTARPTFEDGSDDFLGERRVGVHWSDHDEADLSTWIEEEAAATEAREERARISRQQAIDNATTLDAAVIQRAYMKRWAALGPYIGDHEDGKGYGYDRPIFAMLCAAVRCGETDAGRCAARLQAFVWPIVDHLNEHDRGTRKPPSVYLETDELTRRFEDAFRNVRGAVDDHEQE